MLPQHAGIKLKAEIDSELPCKLLSLSTKHSGYWVIFIPQRNNKNLRLKNVISFHKMNVNDII